MSRQMDRTKARMRLEIGDYTDRELARAVMQVNQWFEAQQHTLRVAGIPGNEEAAQRSSIVLAEAMCRLNKERAGPSRCRTCGRLHERSSEPSRGE